MALTAINSLADNPGVKAMGDHERGESPGHPVPTSEQEIHTMSVQRIAGPKQMSETTTVKEILAQSIQLGVVSLARLDSETPRPPKVEKVKDEKGKTVTKTVERPLTFSGGSLGFTGSGKVEVREGERYQVTVTAVLIGSKPIE